jgi:hypothetical protein
MGPSIAAIGSPPSARWPFYHGFASSRAAGPHGRPRCAAARRSRRGSLPPSAAHKSRERVARLRCLVTGCIMRSIPLLLDITQTRFDSSILVVSRASVTRWGAASHVSRRVRTMAISCVWSSTPLTWISKSRASVQPVLIATTVSRVCARRPPSLGIKLPLCSTWVMSNGSSVASSSDSPSATPAEIPRMPSPTQPANILDFACRMVTSSRAVIHPAGASGVPRGAQGTVIAGSTRRRSTSCCACPLPRRAHAPSLPVRR